MHVLVTMSPLMCKMRGVYFTQHLCYCEEKEEEDMKEEDREEEEVRLCKFAIPPGPERANAA